MNLKQIEEKLNENLDILVDMACYSGDITGITKVENNIITKVENNIKSIIPVITQLLEELRDEELKRDFKTTSEDRWSAIGYNACAKSINSKINKILNK